MMVDYEKLKACIEKLKADYADLWARYVEAVHENSELERRLYNMEREMKTEVVK